MHPIVVQNISLNTKNVVVLEEKPECAEGSVRPVNFSQDPNGELTSIAEWR